MGVFKWLRRDRLSLGGRRINQEENIPEASAETVDEANIGTIRTDEYKRSLAEFQARRFSGNRDDFETPENKPKRKSARHSLPVSCTKCSNDLADISFNYEKTSARNYNKTKSRRNSIDERVPNIQFLFSNQQVFMPGNVYTRTSYTEVQQSKRSLNSSGKSRDGSLTKHRIDFDVEDKSPESPPLYFKNNCLPFEINNFIESTKDKDESINELRNIKMEAERDVTDNSNKLSPSKSSVLRLEEVMDELKTFDDWADEQLRLQSVCTNKSDESKSEISYYGLPLVSMSAINITDSNLHSWEQGHWGIVPVHIKKLSGVTLEQVRKRQCVEVNILRKFRHPNMILLMGLYSDMDDIVHIICERCVGTIYNILHDQGNIFSVQTSVSYTFDVASALAFLHMQGFLHTDINSTNIMVTNNGVAKLADLRSCVKYTRITPKNSPRKRLYENEVEYVNLDDGKYSTQDCQPLISANPSVTALTTVAKTYKSYAQSELYRWQSPELFVPDDSGLVHPSSRSDVYSLCLVLWECCNAAIPWQSLSYEKLSELYVLWKTGIRLPRDGSYPGCMLDLMQAALKVDWAERTELKDFVEGLQNVKAKLADMEDILIPIRLTQKSSGFSSNWDANSLSDLEYRSCSRTKLTNCTALIHQTTSDCSRQENNSPDEGVFEVYKIKTSTEALVDNEPIRVTYGLRPEKEYSSQCSTPVTKRMSLKSIGTPGEQLHKSDSTEYCSFLSPTTRNLDITDNKDEKPCAKLSRSFTPKSYKSLKIQIPSVENLDDIKSMSRVGDTSTPSYKFDIKDYSLPTTPIARSNKLRKNAWLSGDVARKSPELKIVEDGDGTEKLSVKSAPQINTSRKEETEGHKEPASIATSPESAHSEFDRYCNMKSPAYVTEWPFVTSTLERCRSNSWTCRPQEEAPTRVTEDVLSNVNVKPLVAIHEKWISEANRKNERSFSLPEAYRRAGPSVKPASHSVDPHQTSVPQLNKKKMFRSNATMSPTSSYASRRGSQSEQYTSAREKIARSISFTLKDAGRDFNMWSKERNKCTSQTKHATPHSPIEKDEDNATSDKTNSATNTSLDDFVKQLIKREFYQLLSQSAHPKSDDELIQRGTENILNSLKTESSSLKSLSRVKINGNNKPLIEITFNKAGENRLHVLDDRVNVTICDKAPSREDLEEHVEAKDDVRSSLKRCQAFSSIQEARSTEDLYIDDDIDHMEENFGDMKLIPLHGSLHEVLCERADDCCLLKVKQENGCDKVYFYCDNNDPASKDDIDGSQKDDTGDCDKVIFKRSISVVEERIERLFPKDRKSVNNQVRAKKPSGIKPGVVERAMKIKPDVFTKMSREARVRSKSANGEIKRPKCIKSEEVVNIENLTSYHSSSDESLKGENDVDEFEQLEKKVEEDLASANTSSNVCGLLEKISEENLSTINDDDNGTLNDLARQSGIFRAEIRKTRSCENLKSNSFHTFLPYTLTLIVLLRYLIDLKYQ